MSDPTTRESTRRPLFMLLAVGVIALVAAALVTILALDSAMSGSEAPQYATVLPAPRPLPDLALVDHTGQAFSRERFEGEVSLVFFGFTNCPDVCPITLSSLATLKSRIEAQSDERLPNIVFVSVDPARDKPQRVATYLQAFSSAMTGVVGELAEIDSLARALGAFHARPETGDGYDVEHSAGVFLVDSRARFAGIISAPIDISRLYDDWPRIVAALH